MNKIIEFWWNQWKSMNLTWNNDKVEVSKSIYHSLKSIKLPNEIMIISNENDGLCGQFCEFQVKIDDSTKSKFDVWTVSNWNFEVYFSLKIYNEFIKVSMLVSNEVSNTFPLKKNIWKLKVSNLVSKVSKFWIDTQKMDKWLWRGGWNTCWEWFLMLETMF